MATYSGPPLPPKPVEKPPVAPPRGPGHSFQPPGAPINPRYTSAAISHGQISTKGMIKGRTSRPSGKSAPPPGLGLGKPGQNEGSASIWCCIITSIVVVLAGGGGAAVYFLVIAPSLAEDVTFSAAAWVNEIDYDQVGADIAEFVEIGLDNTVVSNVSEVDVYVYLGQSQTFSLKTNLGSGETSNNSGSIVTARPVSVPVIIGGVTLYTIDYTNGDLENGPDGIAVVVDNVLQEFISYEGVFTALDGPAQGVTSVNWGVEDVNTEAGSLQLVGAGNKRTDFAFGPRTPPTKGAVNTGQSFV